jgi:hypothetical protein
LWALADLSNGHYLKKRLEFPSRDRERRCIL